MSLDPDSEDNPRNAAAIRTAIMLGACFVQDERERFSIDGIAIRSKKRTFPAWLYLSSFGYGIDEHGKPRKFSDIIGARMHVHEQEGLRGDRENTGDDPQQTRHDAP